VAHWWDNEPLVRVGEHNTPNLQTSVRGSNGDILVVAWEHHVFADFIHDHNVGLQAQGDNVVAVVTGLNDDRVYLYGIRNNGTPVIAMPPQVNFSGGDRSCTYQGKNTFDVKVDGAEIWKFHFDGQDWTQSDAAGLDVDPNHRCRLVALRDPGNVNVTVTREDNTL